VGDYYVGGFDPVVELAGVTVFHGDCREVLAALPDDSVDSIVTDPPYELGFMGKKWDASGIAYDSTVWGECLRVLKPGGHMLAFGGTRTWHRLAVAVEDAGFEIRDNIAWMYGSGFPKSLDVSKAIDKAAGAQREVVGRQEVWGRGVERFTDIGQDIAVSGNASVDITAPATPAAKQWQGWGTALKPALEPIVVARKPLTGTVASNVLEWGTGGLNIDGSRIGTMVQGHRTNGKANDVYGDLSYTAGERWEGSTQGRWPANVILDEHTAELLDEQSGKAGGGFGVRGPGGQTYASGKGFANTLSETGQTVGYGDTGGASRFFYVAKASKRDRNEGLDGLEAQRYADREKDDGAGGDNPRNRTNQAKQNFHPTVKPTALMRYLVKLVTPPGGTVLDPFTGSGSTGKAALLEGFDFVGVELTEDYLPIIEGRLNWALENRDEDTLF